MSKIATYPSADTPLQLSDRLIGTEAVRPIPSKTPLATKNFSLGELLQLFSSEFPAATLQAVLNAGNIATQDITLIGTITSSLIIPTNIQDMLGSQGTTFQYLSKAVGGFNWVDLPVDGLQAVLDKSNTATQNIILVGDITSTKIIPGNIQDETSSIGTTGQVLKKTATGIEWGTGGGGGSQNLQQVVDIGNTITYTSPLFVSTSTLTGVGIDIIATDIDNLLNYNVSYNVGGITLQSDGNIDPYQNGFSVIYPYGIDISDGLSNQAIIRPYYIYISEAATNKVCYIYPDNISFQNGVGNGTISSQLLTDAILFNLPNKPTGAYTLATTDDITSQSLQSVTDVGNITTNDIIVRHDGFTDIKISSQSGIDNNRIQLKNSLSKLILFCENNQSLIEFNDNRGVAYLRADQQLLSSTSSGKIIEIDAYSNIIKLGANGIIIFGDSGGSSTAQIKSDLITGVVYQQLPNQSGTFAMLSDIPSLTGYVPTSRTLTINGVGYDLTADRSWTIATGSGTVTSISTTGLISGGTITSSGTITTSMATNKLVGRYSTGTGIMEEITIGSGLTLTAGGILNNTATPTGTGYYGAFQDMLTQTLTAANVGQPFLIRTLDEANQVSITANGSGQLTRITPANTGTYNIQWSGQFQNPDNAIHDVNIWFRKGLVSSSGPGTDVVGSNGLVAMPARKSAVAGEEGHVVAGWNFVLTIAAGEYVEFYWMSDSTQVTLQAYAAGSPPPSTASLIVTVTQQAGILAGTGITAINSLTGAAQTLTVGTTGTDFAIVDSGIDHKFNLPTASATNRGALSTTDWTTFNNKQNNLKTFNRTQGVYYFEEFMGGNGGNVAASYTNVVTSISGVGASCVSTASAPNRTNQQGVVLHSTGTTALGVAGYNYGATTLFIGKGTISIETYVTIATLSTSAERFYTQFGYAVPSNWQNTPNAIFFSYDEGGVQFFDGNATPNFKCYTKGTAGTRTFTITTVPVVANQWYKLRIDINAAASSVTFYIDGNLVATHTTNIPAITTPMVLVSQIIKTVGLTARTMYTDYFMYEELFTTAR